MPKQSEPAGSLQTSTNTRNGKEDHLYSRNKPLSNFTEDALRSYFKNLNGHKPAQIYRLVLGEVEPPLFRAVLEYTDGNQTLAAEMLGLNRATLRKKLKQYDLRS